MVGVFVELGEVASAGRRQSAFPEPAASEVEVAEVAAEEAEVVSEA